MSNKFVKKRVIIENKPRRFFLTINCRTVAPENLFFFDSDSRRGKLNLRHRIVLCKQEYPATGPSEVQGHRDQFGVRHRQKDGIGTYSAASTSNFCCGIVRSGIETSFCAETKAHTSPKRERVGGEDGSSGSSREESQ